MKRHSIQEAIETFSLYVEGIFRNLLGNLIAVLAGSMVYYYLSQSSLGGADMDITAGLIVAAAMGRIVQRAGF